MLITVAGRHIACTGTSLGSLEQTCRPDFPAHLARTL